MNMPVQRGFTLIEIIIIVLLMSVMLGLSIPGYKNYTLKTERADAADALLQLSTAQERFYLKHGRYAGNDQLQAPVPDGLGFANGASSLGYYDLSIEPHADGLTTGYIATATVNADERQNEDSECLSLGTDQDGNKSANGDYSQASVDYCWQ